MRFIVGLGNPGIEYETTRHNAGFLALNFLQKSWNFPPFLHEKKWKAAISFGLWKGEKTMLIQPQTFMNLSGEAVSLILAFYKAKPSDLLVIFDDIDLPVGTLKTRENGSAGGHNGIKSIIEAIGTDAFLRLKIGIANEFRARANATDFVLGRFLPAEQNVIFALFPEIERRAAAFLGGV